MIHKYSYLLAAALATSLVCVFNLDASDSMKASDVQQTLLTGGQKAQLTKEQRVSDVNMLIGMLETGYAPIEWKEELFGISFGEMSSSLLAKASEDIPDADFNTAIAEFLTSLNDSHTGVRFPSTLSAQLPFDADMIDGHVIVIEVVDGVPLSVGDEIISVDEKDVKSVLDELKRTSGGAGNPASHDRYAAYYLTVRPQSLFSNVPSGKTTFGVISHADGKAKDVVLEWKMKGYEMAGSNPAKTAGAKAMSSGEGPSMLEQLRWRAPVRNVQRSSWNVGMPNSFFPLGEGFVARKTGPYPTGVMVQNSMRIGYLRIHHYSTKKINEAEALKELEEEISYFEQNTDAIIIDQTGNTGGNYCFTLQIASFFFNKGQKETPDRIRANRENLMYLEGDSMRPDLSEIDNKMYVSLIKEFRRAIDNGDLLTSPQPICSADGLVKPYVNKEGKQITYTKPVLILVDELAVSCGDSFPVIMQDVGRAVLFGARTSGAGGSIKNINGKLGYSEMELFFTSSLGVRERTVKTENGIATNYVENVGAVPDIPYKITLKDLYEGYRPYQKAVFDAVKGLVNSSK